MNHALTDPMGQAILDYAATGVNQDILVTSDISEDDIIPSSYLHRSYEEMPEMERIALVHCKGTILDIGAGAGIHTAYLRDQNFDVKCIDVSPGAVQFMQSKQLDARQLDFFQLKGETYDTLLMLMNGIGIAGTLSNLEYTLRNAYALLNENGQLICDSSDVKYVYEDEDGAIWMDLNAEYYGNFTFEMSYKAHTSVPFKWLYVDFENLTAIAEKVGFKVTKLAAQDEHYLVQLKR